MSDKNTAEAPTWKNPSAATMQRCGLVPLPEDFEPTAEEKILLDMYETVRKYERQAKKIREESARKKLEASKMAFEQKQAPKKKRKRKKKDAELPEGEAGGSDDEGDDDEDGDDDDDEAEASDAEMSRAKAAGSDEDDDDEDAKAEREQEEYERREAKLERLRQEVEQKKQTAERKEEELRAEHLENEDDVMAGVSVRKKIKIAPAAASSLIKNLKPGATPPHDFSTSYELQRGEVMFPTEDMEPDEFWSPPEEKRISHPTEGALEIILDNFDLQAAENGTGTKSRLGGLVDYSSRMFYSHSRFVRFRLLNRSQYDCCQVQSAVRLQTFQYQRCFGRRAQ